MWSTPSPTFQGSIFHSLLRWQQIRPSLPSRLIFLILYAWAQVTLCSARPWQDLLNTLTGLSLPCLYQKMITVNNFHDVFTPREGKLGEIANNNNNNNNYNNNNNIMKMKKWSSQWTQFMQLRKEAWKKKKFRTSTGFEPVTSRCRCDALTNWAMKPLTLGAGPL